MGVDKPKYDFYENAAFLDDPTQADLSRKPRCNAPKIGTEPRVNFLTFMLIDAIELLRIKPRTLVLPKRKA